jgi:ESF2/ABP1 family protein
MAALLRENDDKLKPGIIYFSRLPPFMKPAKVRYLFAQYGEIGRLFLQPEGIAKNAHVFGKGVEISK